MSFILLRYRKSHTTKRWPLKNYISINNYFTSFSLEQDSLSFAAPLLQQDFFSLEEQDFFSLEQDSLSFDFPLLQQDFFSLSCLTPS
ncbi:hypothetical protein CCAND93_310010 [Capnocytophaga canis]|uniref:Uncharacterized protein n=1 Tax=Capnocytophaga canis TaxID=1848903 RepID=A0A0B7ILS5_9FLAO|nr:hypothetical protein CCAND93_310010 [Capnocytophaga canis]